MPDWGGMYSRHDPATSKFFRDLWVNHDRAREPPQRQCDCWKKAEPLCAECQRVKGLTPPKF
jgi:hypothetical protein